MANMLDMLLWNGKSGANGEIPQYPRSRLTPDRRPTHAQGYRHPYHIHPPATFRGIGLASIAAGLAAVPALSAPAPAAPSVGGAHRKTQFSLNLVSRSSGSGSSATRRRRGLFALCADFDRLVHAGQALFRGVTRIEDEDRAGTGAGPAGGPARPHRGA
jgi:hypothetical protein